MRKTSLSLSFYTGYGIGQHELTRSSLTTEAERRPTDSSLNRTTPAKLGLQQAKSALDGPIPVVTGRAEPGLGRGRLGDDRRRRSGGRSGRWKTGADGRNGRRRRTGTGGRDGPETGGRVPGAGDGHEQQRKLADPGTKQPGGDPGGAQAIRAKYRQQARPIREEEEDP
jgi:hypothetical protein